MVGLKTTMVIDNDPLGTQDQAEQDAAAIQAKIDQRIAHPTAVVQERPQDTQPVSPLATKVVEHEEVQMVETAPGVQARMSPQEPTGNTRVVLHALSASDPVSKGAMGACRVQVIDDPEERARAVREATAPLLKATPKKAAKKKAAKKKAAKKKTAKKRVVKKAVKK